MSTTPSGAKSSTVPKIMPFVAFVVAILLSVPATYVEGEEACIKYHKCVPLDQFKCENITRSSFIRRVCYVEAERYMLIQLNDTYYHYCGIEPEMVTSLLKAPSMGRYYNGEIRSNRNGHGPFDCRDHPIPAF